MHTLRLTFCVILFSTFADISAAQTTTSTPSRDPQAVQTLQRSLASLAGPNLLTDVTLTGTATRTAGSDTQTGTATLKATAVGQSRVDLALSGGQRSEVRDSSSGPPVGSWVGPSGSVQPLAQHNLWTEPSWFFPAFVVARVLSNSNYAISPVDQEARSGTTVLHISVFQQITVTGDTSNWVQRLSQMDIYLDPSSLLPVAISVKTHPDDNANLNIPMEFDYSGYRLTQGAQVPFHVQELLNNVVLLDVEISQASFNTGLTTAAFSLP